MAPKGLGCGFLFLLLLAVLSQVSCGRKMDDHHHHSDPSSHMMMTNHHMMMDPGMTVFFFLEDLVLGKNFSVSLEDKIPNPLTSPFLFRTEKEADVIPFSSDQLPAILQHFSFPEGSHKAQVLEKTLRQCEVPPIKGETKFCATSFETMVKFSRQILGFENDIRVLATKFEHPAESSEVRVQEYRIARIPQQILAPKMVTCHGEPYPYVVMYCHTQEDGTRLYRLFLQPKNDGEGSVETLAVCHMDTSQWSPDHASFRVLGIQPGSAPVCHFLPTHSFSLVPSTTASSGI